MNHSPTEPLSISGNYVAEIIDGWNNNFTSSGIFTSDWQNYALALNKATSNAPIANSQNTNLTAQSIAVAVDRADLILQNAVIPSSASIGSNIELKYQVKNQGKSNAIASTTKFYLSQDKTLSNDDKYLGYDAVNIIAAGVNTCESTTIKIDNSISPDSYYLISQADSDRVVSESNESNNIVASTINITPALPDLKLQNVESPNVVTVPDKFTISYQIKNQGVEKSLPTVTKFYLSPDKTLSQNDLYLGYTDIGSLAAGAYNTKTSSLRIGKNIGAGSYYLLFKADGYNSVIETNESNNIVAKAVIVNNNFSSIDGYGLINAAAAMAQVLGENSIADVPNLGGNNWGADLINVPEVWATGYTGKGITVAVLDTGVERNHVDLKANIWKNTQEIAGNGKDDDGNGYIDDVYGWNFAANNNNTLDKKGHGTHTAGTIAGVKNSFGVTGIAYDAKIMPVKVLDDNGSGTDKAIALGIRYAVNNGANVINLSVGKYLGNAEIKSAIQYASSKGAIVVMAAGNDGGSTPYYPANYAQNWGLAVGAVDRYGEIASFSNFAGSELIRYVTAPGVSVYSTVPNNKYASWNGTSMATPYVAGVVALMLSANKNLTDAQVRKIVIATASNNLSA